MTDALGRAAREDTFDKVGRVVTSKDALGNLATSSYDATGNLVGVETNQAG
ncbi:MAG TPA: hypothetical protein VNT01_09975 [Symbiobacteriaceae bacterium]|nr:hypothetical protein [Symbiobacteriaceae bacterium]